MSSLQDLKKKNTIAYDKVLRERIDYVHKLLGTKVTDIVGNVLKVGHSWVFEVEKIRQDLSSITADLNLYLMEGKGEEINHVFNEKELIEKLKQLHVSISEKIVSSSYSTSKNVDKWLKEAEALRSELSSHTAGLTLALMNAVDDKKTLSEEEKASFRGIQLLTDAMGNFLFAFTRLTILFEKERKLLQEIINLSNPLMDKIITFVNTYNVKKDCKNNIKNIIDFLGNSQFKLNKSLIIMSKYQKLSQEIDDSSFDLSKKIIDTQEIFRRVRGRINNLGFLSEAPSMASLFRKATRKDSTN